MERRGVGCVGRRKSQLEGRVAGIMTRGPGGLVGYRPRKTRPEACYTAASRADDRGVSVCVNLCNKVEARWVSHSRSASPDLLPSGQRAG